VNKLKVNTNTKRINSSFGPQKPANLERIEQKIFDEENRQTIEMQTFTMTMTTYEDQIDTEEVACDIMRTGIIHQKLSQYNSALDS